MVWRHEIICDFTFPLPPSMSCFTPQTLLICKLSSWKYPPLPRQAFLFSFLILINPSSLHLLQDFRGFNLKKKTSLCNKFSLLSSSSVLRLLLTLLFLLFLFLLMCRVFPGVAAGRRCLAALAPGAAAAAAASGAWGWEGASAGGAPSKRTQWSCRRRSLAPRLLLPAPPLWSPARRSTPTPLTSRDALWLEWAEPVFYT